MSTDPDTLSLLLVPAIETLALLGIALFCLARLPSGGWAPLGMLGGLIGAVAPAVSFAAYLQLQATDGYSILQAITDHRWISLGLGYSAAVGLVLVALSFVLGAGRRAR